MTPFLICATPRSGSAWLANFLTYDGVLCVHEPMVTPVPDGGHWLVGGVDTGAAHFPLPASKRIYQLRRDEREVERSLRNMGLPYIPTPRLDVQTWNYADLFTLDTLREIWAEMVGTPFDAIRATLLIEMNVQHSIAPLQARVNTCLGLS